MQEKKGMEVTIWSRFRKNKPALSGLFIILLCLMVSFFGYWLAPDNTPDADLQVLEVQSQPPGFEKLFLTVPKSQIQETGIFSTLLYGSPSRFDYIPVNSYVVSGDSISVEKYVDEDTSVWIHYSISNIIGNNTKKIESCIVRKTFLLGTDVFGRDILSRLIIGTRVSMAVGFIAVLVALFVGIILGAMAGYYRGRTDDIIMWLINVVWSIPTLLLVFAFTIAFGKGFWQIFIAVGLTMWIGVARLVRGQVMAIRELEYVQAAKVMGFSDLRIIVRHILPNMTGPLLVVASGIFASAIIIEAGLSFLGIGIQPPQPSWGLMIRENYTYLITDKPMMALIPGLAIMLLVLAFNFLGSGLRDAFDVKSE